MATKTTNLGLTKPDYTDAADVVVLNDNFDLLDHAIAADRVNNARHANVYNLLDNSDFRHPVNQRAQNNYAGVYGIDRWRTWDSGVMELANNGLTVQNAALFQYFAVGALDNAVHTLAAMTTDGNLMVAVMNPHHPFAYAENGLGLGIDNNVHIIVLPPGYTFAWAALYEGEYTAETLPPYMPKGYAAELAECMRYYQPNCTAIGRAINTGYVAISYNFSPSMRVAPTCTAKSVKLNGTGDSLYSGNIHLAGDNNYKYQCSGCGNIFTTGGAYQIIFDASADL